MFIFSIYFSLQVAECGAARVIALRQNGLKHSLSAQLFIPLHGDAPAELEFSAPVLSLWPSSWLLEVRI